MTQSLEWRLAFRNLFRNKRRSISTAIGLIIAFMGISLLFGYLYRTERGTKTFEVYLKYMGDVQIYKKGGGGNVELDPARYQIEEKTVEAVNQTLKKYQNEIEFVAGLRSTEALLSTGTNSIPIWLQGIPPELDTYIYQIPEVSKCCPAAVTSRSELRMVGAVAQYPDAISISKGVGELLKRNQAFENISLDQRQVSIAGLTSTGDLNAVSATLAMKHTTGLAYVEDVSVFAPLQLVQDLLQSRTVSRIAIFIKEKTNRNRLIENLRKDFESQNLDVEVLSFDDEKVGIYYNETASFLFSMGGFIGTLILMASGLIVMNSITMSALERMKEMGTMRALGYLPFLIRRIFVKEAACISVLACLAAIILSEVVTKLINSLGILYDAPGISFPLSLEIRSHPLLYVVLSLSITGVSTLLSFAVVSHKSKQPIPALLLDSGASA